MSESENLGFDPTVSTSNSEPSEMFGGQDLRKNLIDSSLSTLSIAPTQSAAREAIGASRKLDLPVEVVVGDMPTTLDYVQKRDEGLQIERLSTPILNVLSRDPYMFASSREELKQLADADEAVRSYGINQKLGRSSIHSTFDVGFKGTEATAKGLRLIADEAALKVVNKQIDLINSLRKAFSDNPAVDKQLTSPYREDTAKTFAQYNAMPKDDSSEVLGAAYELGGFSEAGRQYATDPVRYTKGLYNTLLQSIIPSLAAAPVGGVAGSKVLGAVVEKVVAKRIAGGLAAEAAVAAPIVGKITGSEITAAGAMAGASATGTFGGDVGAESAGRFAENGGDLDDAIAYGLILSTADAVVNAPFGMAASFVPVKGSLTKNVLGSVGVAGLSGLGGGFGATAGNLAVGKETSAFEFALESLLELGTVPGEIAVTHLTQMREAYHREVKRQEYETLKRGSDELTTYLAAAAKLEAPLSAPETFNQLFDHLAAVHNDGEPVELTIEFSKLLEIIGEEGVAEARKNSKALDEQVDDARKLNGSVTLPFGDFSFHIAKQGNEAQLAQNVRRTANDMTTLEAKEIVESFEQSAQKIYDESSEETLKQIQAIESDVLEQLNTSVNRFTPDVNAKYAKLTGAFFSTMAHRLGMTPEAFYSKYKAKYSNAEVGAKKERVDAASEIATGKPLSVTAYHGSREDVGDFSNFEKAQDGATFFTEKIEAAQPFGTVSRRKVSMQNPMVITNKELEDMVTDEESANDVIPREKIAGLVAQARAAGHDGLVIRDFYDTGVDSTAYLPFSKEQIAEDDSTDQTANLRRKHATLDRKRETLRKFGLKPGKKYKTREVAAALERRTQEKWGIIPKDDRSQETVDTMSKWMTDEIMFEMEDVENSGVGWYTEKYQKAIDALGEIFPELLTDQNARNHLTLFVAITSDGQKVVPNFAMATDIYANFRASLNAGGPAVFRTSIGHARKGAMNQNLERIKELYELYGDSMHDKLMESRSVAELAKIARAEKKKFSTDYPAAAKMPMAALTIGAKLGAFYGNLRGDSELLTMDRWWSRTINRYRGQLTTKASESSLARFREMLGNPTLTREETLQAAVEASSAIESRGFKTQLALILGRSQPSRKSEEREFFAEIETLRDPATMRKAADAAIAALEKTAAEKDKKSMKLKGKPDNQFRKGAVARIAAIREAINTPVDVLLAKHALERTANTIRKQEYENLEDAPGNASDRMLMITAAKAAAKRLKRKGVNLSIADIQAALWYYEKKLYNEQGAVQSGSKSFLDAAGEAVAAIKKGTISDLAAAYEDEINNEDEDGDDVGSDDYIDDEQFEQPAYRGDVQSRTSFAADGADPTVTSGGAKAGWGLYATDSKTYAQAHADKKGGRVFKLEIPEDNVMLNFDRGIGWQSQSGEVIEGLKALAKTLDAERLKEDLESSLKKPGGTMLAEDFYFRLAQEEFNGDEKAASLALLAVGIEGNKFTPSTADRKLVEGVSSYVVFDGSRVTEIQEDPTGADSTLLNVGLDIPGSEVKLTEEEVVRAIESKGVKVVEFKLHQSESEMTLVAKLDKPLAAADANALSDDLKQEAIVQRHEGVGEMFGPKAEAWGPYNPELFVMFDGTRASELPSSDQSFKQESQPNLFNSAQELEALEMEQAKAKGLDMSLEARLKRAKEMGFETAQRWYHATMSGGFTAFKKFGGGKTHGTGVFLTDAHRMAGTYMRGLAQDPKIGRPDQVIADPEKYGFKIEKREDGWLYVTTPQGFEHAYKTEEDFADDIRKGEVAFETSPAMYELFVRLNEDNVLEIDWQGRSWSNGPTGPDIYDVHEYESGVRKWVAEFGSQADADAFIAEQDRDDLFVTRSDGEPEFRTTDDAARFAREQGYEALRIVNVVDPGPYSARIGAVEGTVLVVMDPSNIRSVDAAFDPEFSNSDNILSQNKSAPLGAYHVPTKTISLLETANLSTFLHELGHFYFETLGEIAAQADAPQEIVDDFNALLKFIGYGGTAAQWMKEPLGRRREGHEKVAETFEQYLQTGRAPSLELQPLFSTFAAWLTSVYKSLQRMLKINSRSALNEEVSAVFDRMLATQDAIREAAEIRALVPQFKSAEEAGMTAEKWAEYMSYGQRTVADAEDSLRSRMMRDMRWLANTRAKLLRDITEEAKAKRKSVNDEVTAEVSKMRVYRLMDFLRRGKLVDAAGVEQQNTLSLGSTKLNLAAVKAMSPESLNLKALGTGKYGMLAADGMDPGMAAGLFGYASADEMLRDLLSAENKGDLITGMTDQRTLERHGDISTQEGLQRAADEALANEAHIAMVATELASHEKRVGQVSLIRKAAKYAAMGLLNKRTIRNVRPDQSAASAARARKASTKAMKAGKRDEAAAASRNELLHLEMQKQGIEIRREVEKFVRSTSRIFKGKASEIAKRRDLDMVNAARAVLAAYGIGPKGAGAASSKYMVLLAQYNGARAEDIKTMIGLLPTEADGSTKEFKDLTVEEFRRVADVVNGIYEMAKSEKQVMIDGQKVALDDVASVLVNSILEKNNGELPPLPGYSSTTSRADEIKSEVLGALALIRRVEPWARAMGSAWTTYIFNPVADALGVYKSKRNEVTGVFLELLKGISGEISFTPISAPELNGFTFSGGSAQVVHAILHSGNKSNLKKLLVGRGWGTVDAEGNLDTTKWDAFVARMIQEKIITKNHYDFAQSIWDLLESKKADTQKAHHAMYGYYFSEITAEPVETPFGTYRGGYVPAMADPLAAPDAAQKREAEAMLHSGNSFMVPSTGKGFTENRVEYNRPLELDLRVLGSHLDKVMRFTYLEPAIRDVNKILTNPRVARALNGYDSGVISKMLNPWLQRTARQTATVPGKSRFGDQLQSTLRNRAGLIIMFGNVVNTLQQITGFSLAWLRTPAAAMNRANLGMISGKRKAMVEFMTSKSPFMHDRATAQSYEMSNEIDNLLLNPNPVEKVQDFFKRNAYFLQQAAQNYMDAVVWSAAYDTAVARGATDKQAVRAADEAVRLTQGSFAAEDISAFESNIPFVRLFIQFFGYFNMQYNLLLTEGKLAAQLPGYTEKSKRLMFVYFAGLAIPAFVGALIAMGPPGDDDEDGEILDDWFAMFFSSQARTLAAMAPVVGQSANYLVARLDNKVYNDRVSLSPVLSLSESALGGLAFLGKGAYNLASGESFADEVKKKEIKDALTLVGLLAGLPTGIAGKAVGYEMDVEDGKKSPEGVVDYAIGYTTGK